MQVNKLIASLYMYNKLIKDKSCKTGHYSLRS